MPKECQNRHLVVGFSGRLHSGRGTLTNARRGPPRLPSRVPGLSQYGLPRSTKRSTNSRHAIPGIVGHLLNDGRPQAEQNSGRKARVHLLVPGLPQGAPERRPWDTDLLSNPGHCEETRSGLDRDLQGRPRPTPRFSAASATVNRSGFGVLPVMKRPGSRNIAGLRRRGRLGRSRCRPHRRDPDDLPAWDALETPGLIG